MVEKRRNEREMTLTATYQYDTERFSRFEIDPGQAATGRIYIGKGDAAERVMIKLKGRRDEIAEDEKEKV